VSAAAANAAASYADILAQDAAAWASALQEDAAVMRTPLGVIAVALASIASQSAEQRHRERRTFEELAGIRSMLRHIAYPDEWRDEP
jgi:hypothetical protein